MKKVTTYAISDIHGRKDLWLKANKEVFGPNDTIYFLGDAADRGPDGWEMIKTLLDDERIIYLMGNHEDMLIKAIENSRYENLSLLFWNGGENTYEAYELDTKENQEKYLEKLKELPKYALCYKDKKIIFLSHAGMTPGNTIVDENDWFWDRKHLKDEWTNTFKNIYIVHGHTPVQNLFEFKNVVEPITYCEGHKIDIDLGAFASNKLGILNLDTFEEIIVSID